MSGNPSPSPTFAQWREQLHEWIAPEWIAANYAAVTMGAELVPFTPLPAYLLLCAVKQPLSRYE